MKAVHGGNIYKIAKEYNIGLDDIKDFSANINPLGIPESLVSAITVNIRDIENYPDPDYLELKQCLSDYLGVGVEYIIPGNGATELIFLALNTIKPKKAMVLAPTFAEYERALNKSGADISYYNLDENNNYMINVDKLILSSKDMDALVVCNPNNPTGQILCREELYRLLLGCKKNNTFVFLDEAFIDFLEDEEGHSALMMIEEFDNLFILRALTKFYAMPGLRLGFGITSNKELMSKMVSHKEPWSINTFADIAGRVVLRDKEYIDKTKKFVGSEKIYLYNNLSSIDGLKVYTPSVNYIFFKLLNNIDIVTPLLKKGIMIRSCSNYNNLTDKYYRVAVKTRNDNDVLIEALKEVLSHED